MLSKISKNERLNRTVRRELTKKVQVAVAEPLEKENKAHALFARDDITCLPRHTESLERCRRMLLAIYNLV